MKERDRESHELHKYKGDDVREGESDNLASGLAKRMNASLFHCLLSEHTKLSHW